MITRASNLTVGDWGLGGGGAKRETERDRETERGWRETEGERGWRETEREREGVERNREKRRENLRLFVI